MSLKKLKQMFYSKKQYLFDLDGTLYLGKQLIPGAQDLILNLREQKKDLFFFTNNSSRSEGEYLKKLNGFGLRASLNEIVMSTHTLIRALREKRIHRVFLLGTSQMRRMLQKAGILHQSSRVQAVVVGFDKTLTYEKLLQASRLIASGTPYYVTHPDYFCPTDLGPEPDCGSMALLLEKTTGKKAKAVFGKPSVRMILEVQKRKACPKKKMILVGDRIMTDLEMAARAKIDFLLTLTGDSSRKDLVKISRRPRGVIRSVADLLC